MELLIKSGANVNQADINGETPLFNAALSGKVKVAELLVDSGADVNFATNRGYSPLHEAAERGNLTEINPWNILTN